jgi:hypothetical protein
MTEMASFDMLDTRIGEQACARRRAQDVAERAGSEHAPRVLVQGRQGSDGL